jgi:2-polyprenyl-3-methyl-5-hydroxy-6-metoxy-1,4-benzoquinol methylase
MDRQAWLAERRAAVELDYTIEAPTYDDGYDPATPVHRRSVEHLIDSCPPGGTVLDAACGTGPYIGMVLEAGLRVVGADQSAGMLEQARSRFPEVRFERIGLQELAFEGDFDAAMCVDAMEHVPPEDWLVVLGNLVRAVRPEGHVYLTLEQIDPREVDQAFAELTAADAPAVRGEVVAGDTGGYHFYPDRDRVGGWLADAGLEIVEDTDEWLGGYGYRHLLLRTPA